MPLGEANGNGGCGGHASGVCSASAHSLGSGKRPRLQGPQDAPSHRPRAPRGAWRIPVSAHPSCALQGRRRAPQADWGAIDAGDPDPRGAAPAGWSSPALEQLGGKRPAGSLQDVGGSLSGPGKLWQGSQPPGSAPGPPRFQAADACGSPTPLPPPPRRDLSGLFARLPGSSGSWAGPCASRLQR